MKPLTGRESSLLCLLAQCQTLTGEEIDSFLSCLDSTALAIALEMTGREPSKDARIRDAARGFRQWAEGIASRT